MSSDSVPGSERLLSERVYSTGDLNQSSVGRTISTLSAMSEGSAAESSGSDTDPVVEAGSRTALQVHTSYRTDLEALGLSCYKDAQDRAA